VGFIEPFLSYKHLKMKLRAFSTGYLVVMVSCCLTMLVYLCDTIRYCNMTLLSEVVLIHESITVGSVGTFGSHSTLH